MTNVVQRSRSGGSVRARRRGKTLLVASTGGHLEQLYRLHARIEPHLDNVEWVTFDTPQARHLLSSEQVHYVPLVAPKDLKNTLRSARHARRLLGSGRFDRVISTGAAVAVPFLSVARARGIEAHYIESAARSSAPSLSGKLVAHLPRVHLYSQYPRWGSRRWLYRGAVFDRFAPGPGRDGERIDRVVVTFGTQAGFGFRRAAERLVSVLREVCADDATILWQTGATDMTGLQVTSHATVPAADLSAAVGEADLVICHAGVGSALMTLEHGRCPILLPRRQAFGEHTDDHQQYIARELSERHLAVGREADSVTCDDLVAASRMSACLADSPDPFRLEMG